MFPLEQPYDINHLTVFLLGSGEDDLSIRALFERTWSRSSACAGLTEHQHDAAFTDISAVSRRIRRVGALCMAKRLVHPSWRVRVEILPWHTADASLTNNKPSAIYRLRPHLPQNIPQGPTKPANLGIEIAPLSQLEALQAQISGGGDGKGKEVAAKVEVGKVAEKIVRNVGAWAQRDGMDPLISCADSQLFNYLHSFGGEVKLT